MINITNDSDGSISIYGNSNVVFKVGDILSLISRYFIISFSPVNPMAELIWDNGDHLVIRKDQPIWDAFWDKSDVDFFAWLQNNILPLAVHLNAIEIMDSRAQHTGQSPSMLNCITDESFIQTRTGSDVLQLIESNEKVRLQLRNPNNNSYTTLEFEPIHATAPSVSIRDVGEQLSSMNTSYRNALSNITTKKFKKYKESFEVVKQAAYLDGMNKGIQMQTAGWKIIMIGGRKYMNYPGRILVETITDYDDVRYKLPQELIGLFWVQDIIVSVQSNIMGASAAGFNPHRTDSSRSNTLDQLMERHSMCIGDLGNAPFSRLPEMVEMYKNINMKSNYGGFVTQVCQHLLGSRNNDLQNYLDDHSTSPYMRTACAPALKYYGCLKNKNSSIADRAHGEIFGDDEI